MIKEGYIVKQRSFPFVIFTFPRKKRIITFTNDNSYFVDNRLTLLARGRTALTTDHQGQLL